MSSDGYYRLLELVALNPAQEAGDLVEMATEEGFGAEEVRCWLEDALVNEEVIKFDKKHWVVRKGRFSYDKFDHPKS